MTNETSLIRVHKGLRDRLKAMGKKQGRTLEWMANEAIEQYMGLGAEFIEPTPPSVKDIGTPVELTKVVNFNNEEVVAHKISRRDAKRLKNTTSATVELKDPLEPVVAPMVRFADGSQGFDIPITPRNKNMDFCKHGSVKGFCKKGCK